MKYLSQSESDVLAYLHVGPERVILEDQTKAALSGGNVDVLFGREDGLPVDTDFAGVRFFQTRYTTEGRGFSAAGRAEKGDEFPLVYFQIEVVNGIYLAEAFYQIS
jgi:hypothetical protein